MLNVQPSSLRSASPALSDEDIVILRNEVMDESVSRAASRNISPFVEVDEDLGVQIPIDQRVKDIRAKDISDEVKEIKIDGNKKNDVKAYFLIALIVASMVVAGISFGLIWSAAVPPAAPLIALILSSTTWFLGMQALDSLRRPVDENDVAEQANADYQEVEI